MSTHSCLPQRRGLPDNHQPMVDKLKIGERLRQALQIHKMSNAALSEACGVSEQAIGKWLKTGQIAKERLPLIVDLLNLRLEWLLTGQGEMFKQEQDDLEHGLPKGKYAFIPYYKVGLSAGHGAAVEYEETDGEMAFRKTWIKRKGLNINDLVVVRVEGESMGPRLQPGDIVLVDRSRTVVKDGKVYVIRNGDQLRIKRLFWRYDGELIIRSDNPDPIYRDEIVPKDVVENLYIIGEVIWAGIDF